jgi:protein SCO1/2
MIRWNWRLASRLSVVTLAVLVVLIVAIIQRNNAATSAQLNSGNANPNGLQGTSLGDTPAPDFRLTDQLGRQVSLSQFKGKPVVLTFMYTHCPDICPLTAQKMHSAMQMLGGSAHDIGVLAVSTDPKGDTQAAALSFTKAHDMQDYWHYLIGTQTSLSHVWTAYSVYAAPQIHSVSHSTGLYLIDKQGRESVFLDDSFTPAQLASDLKILLNC